MYRFLFLSGLLILCSLGQPIQAADDEPTGEEDFDVSEMIFHHITDSYEWEIAEFGDTHIIIPLPVILYTENGLDIFSSSRLHPHESMGHPHEEEPQEVVEGAPEEEGHGFTLQTAKNTYLVEHDSIRLADGGTIYDFSITKNVMSMFVSVLLMIVIFISVARSYRKNEGRAPKGLQSLFEPIIIFVRDDIAKDAIGPKYERFVPYLLTIFFFIWFNNILGLFPAGANLTGNIAVTMVLALFTLLITLFSANKNYWTHIFNTPGVPIYLKVIPIIPLVEFIGIFTKPFALMVRLFANITAGHIIMLSLFSLIFIFSNVGLAVAPVSVAFATAMYFLELLVALLQAYVFTLLSALYFGGAVEEHHHDHESAHTHEEVAQVEPRVT